MTFHIQRRTSKKFDYCKLVINISFHRNSLCTREPNHYRHCKRCNGRTAYRCQRHTERHQQRRHYRCGRQLHTDRSCRCNTLYRLHGLCYPGDKPGKTKKQGDLKITLSEDTQQLKEVVVTAMGIKRHETCRLCHQYHQCRRIGKGRSTQLCLCHVR